MIHDISPPNVCHCGKNATSANNDLILFLFVMLKINQMAARLFNDPLKVLFREGKEVEAFHKMSFEI